MASVTDSPTFNDKNADIVFLSSDKPNSVRFYIHAKNLEVSAGAFPPVLERGAQAQGETVGLTVDEPVQLPETSTVLEVLFAFMYPRPHPELEDTPFQELAAIAEAVEKYQVFPAISICKVRMRGFLKTQSIGVGLWAARHGHDSILDEAAPGLTALPLVRAVEELPSHLASAWIEYFTNWEKVRVGFLFYRDPQDSDHCNIRASAASDSRCGSTWTALSFPILDIFRKHWEAGENPFLDLNRLFEYPDSGRACCTRGMATWRRLTEEAIRNLPKLSQVVSRRAHK